jgi:2-polyprenyl-6-methoxyphenol hydroxylase-like FAD-dependent oxidoreductase
VAGKRHAEVAGAGLAGLAMAAALAQRGWSVRVHERADELREIGAGIFVWENGLRALEAVGAFAEATQRSERDDRWMLYNERRQLIQSDWMIPGVRLHTMLRTDLHKALAGAAARAGAQIVTSSPVTGADQDGTLRLADGSQARADLVVGADGVSSRVRDTLPIGVRKRDLRDGCGRHLIARKATDPRNATLEFWQGSRRVGIVPCSPEFVYVYLCCPASDRPGIDQASDRATWTDSFPYLDDVIARVPDGGRWASFTDVVCDRWSAGRVAVIGDAAHAMSPNLGQGACVALANAVALADALDRHQDVRRALQIWERAERPVADATQRYSRLYGAVGTKWPASLLGARSAVVWGLSRWKAFQRRVNAAAVHVPWDLTAGAPRRPATPPEPSDNGRPAHAAHSDSMTMEGSTWTA